MLQHKFHCKRFFFSFSKHTTHVLLLHKFHCKSFFFSLSLNTPHTYYCCTSSIAKDFFFFFFSFSKHTTHIHLKSSTPSTLKPQSHKHIKIQNKTFFFFQQFSRLLLFNSINCTTVQDFFLSLPQFPRASTLFLYSSISPLFSFGKLSLAALKNSFSRTSFE